MITLARIVLAATTLASATAGADELPHYTLSESALGQLDEGGGDGAHGTGSLLSGRTMGSGADVIQAQFGWPFVGISYLHGLHDNLDVGGTFDFAYGFEGTVHTDPGLKMAGLIRVGLVDNGKVNLGIRFDPGITMYFQDQFAFGLATPVQLALGVSAGDAIMINFAISMPITIFFTPDVFFSMPILSGVGVEYHVDSHLSITLDTGFGPDVFIGRTGHGTEFAFFTLAGIGYRL